MRITNMHHFTENHRFTVYRDFSLSGLAYKMLSSIYQPMIGAHAVGVYHTLYQQLSGEKVGYSPLEQQRKLFLQLEIEPGEKGRKHFIDQASKLEAVGLLQTNRRFLPESDDYLYDYQLFAPLPPDEFFQNQHLTLLLRDKVGKFMVLLLREELLSPEPEELAGSAAENVSVPFYELFRLNTHVIDYELEQALYETAVTRQPTGVPLDTVSRGFDYTEILARFPKGSRNRPFIEALQVRKDQLAAINITAKKYDLTLLETCRLLDEDGVFDDEGGLLNEVLQYRASLLYRQGKRREEFTERKLHKLAEEAAVRDGASEAAEEKAVQMDYYLEVPALFNGQCDIHQYNMLLRNQPYTMVLKKFFPQGAVPDGVLDIFEKIDLNYGLAEEVINVLIHFVHVDRRSWAKSSIEALASDVLGKQIGSYEQAVDYIREKARYKARMAGTGAGGRKGGDSRRAESSAASRNSGSAAGAGGRGGGKQKPVIPVIGDKPGRKPLSEEELEEARRLAKKLDGKL